MTHHCLNCPFQRICESCLPCGVKKYVPCDHCEWSSTTIEELSGFMELANEVVEDKLDADRRLLGFQWKSKQPAMTVDQK